MAKKFSFRLESLLKLRSHRVNEAKDSLSAVLRVRYSKDEAIANRNSYKKDMLQHHYKSSKASDLQSRIYHKQFVEKEIEKLSGERKQLSEIEEVRRKRLENAMQKEKILLKLKEKQLDSYKKESNLEEMNFIDEIAISGYRNKADDGGIL